MEVTPTKMEQCTDIFVPGRLCILGEHTDWAGQYRAENPDLPKGVCVVCATNEGLYARVSEGVTGEIVYCNTSSTKPETFRCALDSSKLKIVAAEGGFYCYVAGTAAIIMETEAFQRNNAVKSEVPPYMGIRIENYKTTLPMKKGLSSSAAVCVLVAKSFNSKYSLGLSNEELMEVAYKGEMLTPSRCGRMDQCVVMGRNAVGVMEFDGASCSLRRLKNTGTFYFVVVDLNAKKDTVKILRDLHRCFPRPSDDTQVGSLSQWY